MESRFAKLTILLCIAALHAPLVCLLRKLTMAPPTSAAHSPLIVDFVTISRPRFEPPPMVRRTTRDSSHPGSPRPRLPPMALPEPPPFRQDAPVRIPANLLEQLDDAAKADTFHAPWQARRRAHSLERPTAGLHFEPQAAGPKVEPCLRYRNFALGSASTDGSTSCDRPKGSRAEAPDLIRYGEDDAATIERKRREWEEYGDR